MFIAKLLKRISKKSFAAIKIDMAITATEKINTPSSFRMNIPEIHPTAITTSPTNKRMQRTRRFIEFTPMIVPSFNALLGF